MDETQGMIHSEANSLSAVNLWNQTSYVLPKCNGGTSIGQTFPFQKGEIGEKKGVAGSKQVETPRQTILNLRLENNLL